MLRRKADRSGGGLQGLLDSRVRDHGVGREQQPRDACDNWRGGRGAPDRGVARRAVDERPARHVAFGSGDRHPAPIVRVAGLVAGVVDPRDAEHVWICCRVGRTVAVGVTRGRRHHHTLRMGVAGRALHRCRVHSARPAHVRHARTVVGCPCEASCDVAHVSPGVGADLDDHQLAPGAESGRAGPVVDS